MAVPCPYRLSCIGFNGASSQLHEFTNLLDRELDSGFDGQHRHTNDTAAGIEVDAFDQRLEPESELHVLESNAVVFPSSEVFDEQDYGIVRQVERRELSRHRQTVVEVEGDAVEQSPVEDMWTGFGQEQALRLPLNAQHFLLEGMAILERVEHASLDELRRDFVQDVVAPSFKPPYQGCLAGTRSSGNNDSGRRLRHLYVSRSDWRSLTRDREIDFCLLTTTKL